MKKEILFEINRYREIMGLGGLILNEQLGKTLKTLMKSTSTEVISQLKQLLEPYANSQSKSVDTIFDEFSNEFSSASKIGDNEVDNVLEKYGIKSEKQALDDILEIMIKNQPEIFAKSVSNEILGNELSRNLRFYSAQEITTKNVASLEKLVADTNQLLDSLDISDPFTNQAKEAVNNNYLMPLERKIEGFKGAQVSKFSIDDVYDTLKGRIKSKFPDRKIPSLEQLKEYQDVIAKKMTVDEFEQVIKNYLTENPNKMKEFNEVGGMVLDATGKRIEKSAKGFGRVLGSLKKDVGWGGLIFVLGAIGVVGLIMNWEEIRYGTKEDIWKEIYKDSFYSLPEDLKKKIVSSYEEEQATNDKDTQNGVKSFNLVGDSELDVLFHSGKVDKWKKVQQGKNEYWSKDGATETLNDEQILALWKKSNPYGVRKSDGKYYKTSTSTVGFDWNESTKDFK